MEALEIDPMSAASPNLEDGERDALKDSIAKLGQLVPIIIYKGKVLDGRKRLAACSALGKEPLTITIPEDATASDYATALNLFRTHYTASQRAMYAAEVEALANGSNRFKKKVGVPNANATIMPIDAQDSLPTSRELARRFDVHRFKISNARTLIREAAPELVAAVKSGHLSVTAATKITKNVPIEDQSSKVAEIVAKKKNSGQSRSKQNANGTAEGKRSPWKDPRIVTSRFLDNIANSCIGLEDYIDAALDYDDCPRIDWKAKLALSLKILRKFKDRLKEDNDNGDRQACDGSQGA